MEPPPEKDPYRAVWQMSQVGDIGGRRERRIRWLAGIIAGLVVFLPFVLITSAVWGFWGDDEVDIGGGGFAVLLIGLAIGSTLGGFVATHND
jgi:hypothetical protein